MIPYDDLVAALTAWRTRQGLPVAQQATAAPPLSPSSSASSSASRGRGAPAAPAPAAARPGAARGAGAAPAASDFDDALVEDGSYDSGEDFVMQLGGETAESTAIGSAPEPPAPARGKRPGW